LEDVIYIPFVTKAGRSIFPSQMENIVRGFQQPSDEFCIELTTDPKAGADMCTLIIEPLKEDDIPTVTPQLLERLREKCQVTPQIKCVPSGTLPRTVFKAKRIVDKRENKAQ
jgi:phenylacetate-CoA ligase